LRPDPGQATVELIALLPIYALIALAMGQGTVAGYAAWSAAGAARIGARAEALGHDAEPAVRSELPRMLLDHARVRTAAADSAHAGRVTVRLRVPSIVPGLHFGTVRGNAQLPDQVGA
jgi:hypothetical protein